MENVFAAILNKTGKPPFERLEYTKKGIPCQGKRPAQIPI
jgi:hypothetical protein